MLIKDNDTLSTVCQEIEEESLLIVDTEFVRNKCYFPKLCLIQIATTNHSFAVDTLEQLDFKPLLKLLANPNTVKVIHSARQDIEALHHAFGIALPNIFDTQLAMQFLSPNEPISYEGLVKHYLGYKVDKKLQYSDWMQRPLTKEHLEYALLDVVYLRDIYPKMLQDLTNRKRLEWVLDECEVYNESKDFYPKEQDLFKKFLNFFKSIFELQRCLKLVRWRESVARKKNVIRNQILSDDEIVWLVKHGSVNKKIEKRLSALTDELVNVLSNKEESPEDVELIKKIISYRQTQGYQRTYGFDILKILLHKIAYEQEINPSLIATSNDLTKLSSGFKDEKFNHGWRKEIFGDTIEAFLQNKEGVYYKEGKLELR